MAAVVWVRVPPLAPIIKFNKKLAKKHKIWYYNYKSKILGRKSGRCPLFSFKYEVDIYGKNIGNA